MTATDGAGGRGAGRPAPDWPDEVHARAVDMVRQHYEAVAGVVGLGLARINRPRPPPMQYGSLREVAREWLERAGAVSTFAVNLGLITPEDSKRLILEHEAAHPEIAGLFEE